MDGDRGDRIAGVTGATTLTPGAKQALAGLIPKGQWTPSPSEFESMTPIAMKEAYGDMNMYPTIAEIAEPL